MKTSTWLVLGGAAAVAYLAYEATTAVNDINILFSGVDIGDPSNIKVILTVQNITNTSITVNSLAGNLLLNGTQIGAISYFTPQKIIANAQTSVTVIVQPSWLSIAGNIQSLLQSTGTELNFTAAGNVNIEGLPILPFNLQQTVTV